MELIIEWKLKMLCFWGSNLHEKQSWQLFFISKISMSTRLPEYEEKYLPITQITNQRFRN